MSNYTIEDLHELPPGEMPEAFRLELIERHLQRLAAACEGAGLMPGRMYFTRAESCRPSTEFQAAIVRRFAPENMDIPQHWREFLGVACGAVESLNAGAARDLAAVLWSVANAERCPDCEWEGAE
jgi:hypothetical protein